MVIESGFGRYDDELAKYVRPTELVDSDHSFVRKQANELVREAKTASQAIIAIHEFVSTIPAVRDRHDRKASEILQRGRGSCSAKTTLFLALCRVLHIPCRVHAYRLSRVQKGSRLLLLPEVWYRAGWTPVCKVVRQKGEPDWSACPLDDAGHRKEPLRKQDVAQDLGEYWHPDLAIDAHGSKSLLQRLFRR